MAHRGLRQYHRGEQWQWRSGERSLLIAISNPKIAVFFAALFSQFIQPNATLSAQFMIATTAAVIDALVHGGGSAVIPISLVWSVHATRRLVGPRVWRDTHRVVGGGTLVDLAAKLIQGTEFLKL